MRIAGRHFVIAGLGRSGVACARFLRRRGGRVTATDRAAAERLGPAVSGLVEMGVDLYLGQDGGDLFQTADTIVLSPGVPHDLPPIRRARESGIPVIGEMELAARFIDPPLLAITGTNGKTTTTTLVTEMLRASGVRVWMGGNIGNPLIEFLEESEPCDWIVAEVSSFQLDTIERLRPAVAVLLNITEDHLDRYGNSFAAYARSKMRIFRNQDGGEIAVLNAADETITAMADGIAATRRYFNRAVGDGRPGSLVDGRMLTVSLSNEASFRIDLGEGTWSRGLNRENAAAAAVAAASAGATPEGIQSAVNRMAGLPHRISPVAVIAGVTYVDDSKATNPGAVQGALESFAGNVVLILGGRSKGEDYRSLRPAVRKKVKGLVLMGECREQMRAALEGACTGPVVTAITMDGAVDAARQMATAGDVVLLSPACASFDMFDGYAHRGRCFQAAVHRLRGCA